MGIHPIIGNTKGKRTMEMQISKIHTVGKEKTPFSPQQVYYKEKRRDEEGITRLKTLKDIPI